MNDATYTEKDIFSSPKEGYLLQDLILICNRYSILVKKVKFEDKQISWMIYRKESSKHKIELLITESANSFETKLLVASLLWYFILRMQNDSDILCFKIETNAKGILWNLLEKELTEFDKENQIFMINFLFPRKWFIYSYCDLSPNPSSINLTLSSNYDSQENLTILRMASFWKTSEEIIQSVLKFYKYSV